MSKTYLDQVAKAKALVEGLRKNIEQVKHLGISLEDLNNLEAATQEGEALNAEVERLRAEVSVAVAKANGKLVEIKDATMAMKRTVKQYYDMERWADFGIPDKR